MEGLRATALGNEIYANNLSVVRLENQIKIYQVMKIILPKTKNIYFMNIHFGFKKD